MKIRRATNDDGQFILEFIVRNARKHFNPIYENPIAQHGLVDQIRKTIEIQLCPMPDKVYPSDFLVFDNNGIAIAFLWIIQRNQNQSEIYLIGVSSNYQNIGVAKMLLRFYLERLNLGHDVYSRVKEKSHRMKHVLRKLGFRGGFYFPYCIQKFHLKIK